MLMAMPAFSSSILYLWALLLAAIPSFMLILVSRYWSDAPYKRSSLIHRRNVAQLPPGSMGWVPVVGETWEYAMPNQTLLFMQKRVQKYGELFKSHLFGDPIIVSCSSRINRFVMQEEHKLFRSSYPRSFNRVLGEKNVLDLPKELHKKVRGLLINILASGLRTDECMKDISTTIARTLRLWEGRVVRVQDELAEMAFIVAAKRLLGFNEEEPAAKILMEHYFRLTEGLISVPINFPGTAYNRSMKARRKLIKAIDDMISKRMTDLRPVARDFVGALVAEEEKPNSCVTREVTRDSILSVLFAAHDTVSKAMTFAVKYLLDNPKVTEMLREEQTSIREGIKDGEELTWRDYKSMSFSNNVVSEVLRLVNIAPGVFREALEDVEIDGFMIPKGHRVMAYFNTIHLEATNFQDPFQFNPWRWETISLSETNFTPFGGGPRLCPGNEFARSQMCIFLHHLVLKCRFKQLEEDEILYSPYIKFKKGFPLLFKSVQ